MLRFIIGVLTGFAVVTMFVAGLIVVQLHFEKLAINVPKPEAQTPPTAPTEDAPTAVTEADFDPQEVAQARAQRDTELPRLVAPDLPLDEVSDATAVQSARLADALRAATGAVPEANTTDASGLIDFNTGAANGGFAERARDVRPRYFEVWDDLMQRCFATVVNQTTLDETGLTPKDDGWFDYAQPNTEQTWFSEDKAFEVKLSTRAGDARSGILRTCSVRTNRFALVRSDVVGQLKDRFHAWWERERLTRRTAELSYPYDLHEDHLWYGGLTEFGSAQGCPLKVTFSQITVLSETDASFFLNETDENGCQARSATAPGGNVRINRLPQAGD